MSLKLSSSHRAGAWTLMELAVVIILIFVLASFAMSAYEGVLARTKKVQAKNDLMQIVTAVNAFYTEYGRYPTAATTDATATYGAGGANPNNAVFNELRAVTTALNTRQIVFLNLPSASNQTTPVSGIKNATGDYYDPWGTQYALALDADYDNQILNPYPDVDGSAGTTPLRFGVIAWSWGPDKTLGNPNNLNKYKGSDDIISWQ